MEQLAEFAGNHELLVTGLLASFFLVVFTELHRKSRGMVAVGPVEAVKLINGDAAVIDLRSAEAYAKGHIVNARHIPSEELEDSTEQLERLKSKPLVVVCENGMSSGRAATRLRKAGFEQVYALRGGLAAWRAENLPLVGGRKRKSKKKSKTRSAA